MPVLWLAVLLVLAACGSPSNASPPDGIDRLPGASAAAPTTPAVPGDAPPQGEADPPASAEPGPPQGGFVPAGRDRLVGRWEPAGGSTAPQPPHVQFSDNGDWTGSDGCNGVQGTWAVEPDGSMRTTAGPSTLIACDGMVGVPGWVAGAGRAGFDGEMLVLLDADGQELGRLQRA